MLSFCSAGLLIELFSAVGTKLNGMIVSKKKKKKKNEHRSPIVDGVLDFFQNIWEKRMDRPEIGWQWDTFNTGMSFLSFHSKPTFLTIICLFFLSVKVEN